MFESSLNIRLSKRHKADDLPVKLVTDIYDKLLSLDSNATQIPKFVAADLTRIPRESENSGSLASTEQVLASIHSLKSAVKHLESNMITRDDLDARLKGVIEPSSATPRVSKASSASLQVPGSPPSIFPQSQVEETTTKSNNPVHASKKPVLNKTLYAEVLQRQKAKVDSRTSTPKPKRKTNSSVIIGKNVSAGLVSFKGADLTVARYIGRVALGVEADTIRESLTSRSVDVVALEKIQTKHERFSSFKLVLKKSQLHLIEDASFWPEGVIIGRFWAPKKASEVKEFASEENNNGLSCPFKAANAQY